MKYLKFEFPTEAQALTFAGLVQNAYCTIPKVLPIEVNEEGEVIRSTKWIVDVIGEDWRIPNGYSSFQVTPINPIHSIAGMEQHYHSDTEYINNEE